MIQSLYVLNGGSDYVFVVGKQFLGSEVTKIRKSHDDEDKFIVYLKDGRDIDIYSENVITVGKYYTIDSYCSLRS